MACHQHGVLGYWGKDVVDVLYGTDDWFAGAALMNQNPRRILAEERKAIRRADLVLTIGPELADRWRGLGADPLVLHSGCDTSSYQRVGQTDPGPLPEGFPTPVAGVVGQFSPRIDVRLLTRLADAGFGLLLVGPVQTRWSRQEAGDLFQRQNVHHTGAVPYDELPRWFARIDVGLTPYVDSAFNRAAFPLKSLEYLAAGIPVVSSDLPASRLLARETDQVWIADDDAAFLDAVREAATVARSPALVQQRRKMAARHSWEARAREFARLTEIA